MGDRQMGSGQIGCGQMGFRTNGPGQLGAGRLSPRPMGPGQLGTRTNEFRTIWFRTIGYTDHGISIRIRTMVSNEFRTIWFRTIGYTNHGISSVQSIHLFSDDIFNTANNCL